MDVILLGVWMRNLEEKPFDSVAIPNHYLCFFL